jgi:hypothetical protein
MIVDVMKMYYPSSFFRRTRKPGNREKETRKPGKPGNQKSGNQEGNQESKTPWKNHAKYAFQNELSSAF